MHIYLKMSKSHFTFRSFHLVRFLICRCFCAPSYSDIYSNKWMCCFYIIIDLWCCFRCILCSHSFNYYYDCIDFESLFWRKDKFRAAAWDLAENNSTKSRYFTKLTKRTQIYTRTRTCQWYFIWLFLNSFIFSF